MHVSAHIRRRIEIVSCVGLTLTIGVIATVVAMRPTPVGGAAGPAAKVEEGFMYTAKFACAEEVGLVEADFGEFLFVPVKYRTAVDIHYPQRDDVSFQKKAVVALSQGTQEWGSSLTGGRSD